MKNLQDLPSLCHSPSQVPNMTGSESPKTFLPPDAELEQLAFFPIKYPRLEAFYQQQKALFWTAQEIDYARDRDDWDKLDDPTKYFIRMILLLFAQIDGIINANLMDRFQRETAAYAKECSMFYIIQAAVELNHNETYSLLIKTFIRDPAEQMQALNAIQHHPCIKAIAEWSYRYMDASIPLPLRVIAFACLEGIIIMSVFPGIYFAKLLNILLALTKANEWIARDETLHTNFAIELYYHLTKVWGVPAPENSEIEAVVWSAVDAISGLFRHSLPEPLTKKGGLSADDLIGYARCCARSILDSVGVPCNGERESNPMPWMRVISLPNTTNFFEGRVSEYARETGGTEENETPNFDGDEDF